MYCVDKNLFVGRPLHRGAVADLRRGVDVCPYSPTFRVILPAPKVFDSLDPLRCWKRARRWVAVALAVDIGSGCRWNRVGFQLGVWWWNRWNSYREVPPFHLHPCQQRSHQVEPGGTRLVPPRVRPVF